MTTKQNQKTTIENIVKLDSLKDSLSGADLKKLEEVLDSLKETAGDAVSKANASRLLEVSRQTLDRWIEKGNLPSVKGNNGREQIPREVVEKLTREVRDLKAVGQTRSVLADALRRAADDISPAKKTTVKKQAAKKATAKKAPAKRAKAKKASSKKATAKKAPSKK